jgi:peroxiredoxin
MSDISPLLPRQPVPSLKFALAGGGQFDLSQEKPERFTLVVFYRGLHCPQCRNQLKDLESKLGEFEKRGVGVVAVSSDDAERGGRTKQDWGLPNLRLGHGLPLKVARDWGLFISSGRGKTSVGVEEPALFSEPGLFLVRADGTLYFASVQTMPFARPHFSDILTALDFVIAKDYPARGEIASLPAQAAE